MWAVEKKMLREMTTRRSRLVTRARKRWSATSFSYEVQSCQVQQVLGS